MSVVTDSDLRRTCHMRERALESFGEVDADVLTHLLSPSLLGGPAWPAQRQAFRIARGRSPAGRPAVLLASDGLSDPFEDEDEEQSCNGFELELVAATEEPLTDVRGSWLWDLVWQMSQFAAKRGDLAGLLQELGLLSTELYDVRIPDEYRATYVTEHGRVGVLLGLPPHPLPASVAGPRSAIRYVSLKLLTVDELAYTLERGERGRVALADRFAGDWLSSLARPSVC